MFKIFKPYNIHHVECYLNHVAIDLYIEYPTLKGYPILFREKCLENQTYTCMNK